MHCVASLTRRKRSLLVLFSFLVFLPFLPGTALAQALPTPLCGPLPGCGNPLANVATEAAIPILATFLLNLTAALSVLFVIIGGGRFLLAFGRDEEYGKAKKTIGYALGGIIIALTAHQLVTAIISEVYVISGANPVFSAIQSAVRILLTLLNITFLLIIALGGMRMVYARGKEEEVTKGKDMLAYAGVGIVIINIAPLVVKAVLRFW